MNKGVILVNIGTPEKPEPKEVRAYLRRFLGDRRVIDMPRAVWLPILYGPILAFRPRRSAALYKKIWTAEGSPLLHYMKKQAAQLQAIMPDAKVYYAMSYSAPFLDEVLQQTKMDGITDLTVIPMYPQYSTTTTASIYDAVARYYLRQQDMSTLHFIKDYHVNEDYLQLVVKQMKPYLAKRHYDKIILSYHGIPASYVAKGDPYQRQCEATTTALRKLLPDVDILQTYQSKFGPNPWLTPATDETMKQLPHDGVRSVLVVTPGFVADCLETIEEIEEENRHYFLDNGGETFDYVHPFNDDPDFTKLLKRIAEG